jgi:hypothetical protein
MLKDSIKHSSFQLALSAVVLFVTSIFLRAEHYGFADIVMILALLLSGLNWIIAFKLVLRNPFLDRSAKSFWMVLILLIPSVGSIVYIMMENRKLGI